MQELPPVWVTAYKNYHRSALPPKKYTVFKPRYRLSNPCLTCFKKNQNAPRPSEHPPVRGKKCTRRTTHELTQLCCITHVSGSTTTQLCCLTHMSGSTTTQLCCITHPSGSTTTQLCCITHPSGKYYHSVMLFNSREWKYHHSVVLYNSPKWKVLPLSYVV